MKTDDQHSTLTGNDATLHDGLAVVVADGTAQGMMHEEYLEPDAHEHFQANSGYPKAVAKMIALCSSHLVALGETPNQTVKIARHGATHGYCMSRNLARHAETILTETPTIAPPDALEDEALTAN
jgi:hypothetical protein